MAFIANYSAKFITPNNYTNNIFSVVSTYNKWTLTKYSNFNTVNINYFKCSLMNSGIFGSQMFSTISTPSINNSNTKHTKRYINELKFNQQKSNLSGFSFIATIGLTALELLNLFLALLEDR